MENFKKVTHVIFDLDGLILDTEPIYKTAIETLVESFGKKYPNEVRCSVLGKKEPAVASTIVESLQLPVTSEEFANLIKEECWKYFCNSELKPGAERLIQHLSNNNVPIAMATGSSEETFNLKTANYKSLLSKFHHIVTGEQVSNGKPAPDIFLLAAKRFSNNPPKPEYCLVLEDAPNGVEAARAAGMQVVMVPEHFIPQEMGKNATLVLNSLLDFKPELFGLPPFPEE